MGTSNRLLPHQFAPGNTADFTRVEQALLKLADTFNDVPPEFVQRRWSHNSLVWGYSPPNDATPNSLPFLRCLNSSTSFSVLEPPTAADIKNLQRVKSCYVPDILPNNGSQDLFTWEVSWCCAKPTILSGLSLAAEAVFSGLAVTPYSNFWLYGPAAPAPGEPVDDFTVQVCVDDGFDLMNRKRLRQEALVYNTKASAFHFYPTNALPPALDTMQPAHPSGEAWDGAVVDIEQLVLIPAGARVRALITIPLYNDALYAQWGATPYALNVWSCTAQIWEATT
jgi:hypothetical protein